MSESDWDDVELAGQRDRLLEKLKSYGRVAVAYSGGIDSTVVAKAAQVALGDDAVAVTAVSLSLADGELEEAEELAKRIGIRHQVIRTNEFADPNYLRNSSDRCYFCKSELYGQLRGMQSTLDVDVIVSGANTDDAGDHRPGIQAAGENDIRHPLQECNLSKNDVRKLAKAWGLPTWDKPATPCLSSRIAYGEEVTPERVRMIDQAEQLLRGQGLRTLRVRYHKGDLARIEVAPEELSRLVASPLREQLVESLRKIGFKFVTIDLQGFRSGSLNSLVPVELLSISKPKAVVAHS